ncbi:MAG: [FeFe] hydrogenase H-cluster radical SAM maturase HydG [Nitrospiraceae bacterium]|nr:MAG: [FeFe] hydrogenase H-cluster radical SAM maturase HydG [Nitrospiraceae bacterium]
MKSMHGDSNKEFIREILAKSLDLHVLNLKEVSALIYLHDREIWEEVFDTANRIKEKVYGKRVVLFAPLYISNECMNDCLYCGFRSGNRDARRKSLTVDEVLQEAEFLSGKGYRRLLLVASEHAKHTGIDYLEKIIEAIYKRTDIRILHANTAPMSVDEFKRLKASGIGVYQCFQETYHIPSYRYLHQTGTKADYASRLNVMDRAIEAGFEDVGMGVLLGLYDWRWEVGALIAHSRRLISKYGFGPHTLSVPRLQPAEGSKVNVDTYRVSDEDLKKIVAIYRLALPYVGVVVSTRERSGLRDELLSMGASQISAGSRTSPWGYIEKGDTEQFEIGDNRSLEDIVRNIAEMGMIPSLCTACYREGRSGEQFRKLAQNEHMKKLCHENALLSLKEYIEDCCSEDVKEDLEKRLKEEIAKSSNGLTDKMKLVEQGKRDIHS